VDRKRRRALQAQADDIADQQNEFGSGRPDNAAGVIKRRPKRPQGNSRALILRRLRNDHPQLHQLVLDGQISPHRAAIAAGFRQAPGRKPKRRPVDPLELSPDQAQELWLGAGAGGSVFQDEAARHEAWFKHRDQLMKMWGAHARRPLAWWCYESGELDYPGPELERSTLFEAGRLTELERGELIAYWKREFDRACRPDFFVCMGPGHFLEGEEAREAHYRWADIPAELVEAWTIERRRQDTKKEPRSEAVQGPQF
jgi:hypothetical protein